MFLDHLGLLDAPLGVFGVALREPLRDMNGRGSGVILGDLVSPLP